METNTASAIEIATPRTTAYGAKYLTDTVSKLREMGEEPTYAGIAGTANLNRRFLGGGLPTGAWDGYTDVIAAANKALAAHIAKSFGGRV